MRGGRLRHRVTIQQKVKSRGASGQETFTWSDWATGVPASIEPLSGRELMRVQQEHAETKTRIVMRYRAGVTTEMRLVHGSTYYDIKSVIHHDLRGRQLTLMCTDGLNKTDGG